MAHIVRFSVDNLVGREGEYTQELNRDVNIFFGLNGSGKTSLLRILDSAMSNDAQTIRHIPFTKASVTIHSLKFNREFVYTIDKTALHENTVSNFILSGDGTIKSVAPEIHWNIGTTVDGDTGRFQHLFLDTYRLLPSRNGPWGVSESDELYDVSFEKELERQWLTVFGAVQSEVRSIQQKGLVDILNDVLTWGDSKEPLPSRDWESAYAEMVTFLKRQNPRAVPSSKDAFRARYDESNLLRQVLMHIERVERQISQATAPQTKLHELINRLFTGKKTLEQSGSEVRVVTNGQRMQLRYLSSGEKQLLRIFLENIKAENSTLLIDEPELSMHIDWQRELVASLRELNPGSQLIFATHSPEIMADIDDSRIFRL